MHRLEYLYEFGGGPFDLVVNTEGEADIAEFLEGERRLLSDPRYRPGLNLLYDHSRLDVSAVTSAEVRAVAQTDRAIPEPLWAASIAIVAPHPATFGLARMWQLMLGPDIETPITVVRSIAEAHEWLAQLNTRRPRHPLAS
jgi:hypothetical protein